MQLPSDSGPLSVAVSAAAPSVASLTATARRTFAAIHADGVGYTQRLDLRLTNPLSAPVQITGAALAGADGGQFHVLATPCTEVALAPGASCELPVLFEPTRIGTADTVLTLHGNGRPLPLSLRATAHARPAVTWLEPGAAGCISAASRDDVLVGTSEPATVTWSATRTMTWRAIRSHLPAAATCAAPSAAGAPPRASGRSATTGQAATSVRRLRVRGLRTYLARFRLPVWDGASGLRAGVYRLTVTASNGHGTSHARTTTLTVARSGR